MKRVILIFSLFFLTKNVLAITSSIECQYIAKHINKFKRYKQQKFIHKKKYQFVKFSNKLIKIPLIKNRGLDHKWEKLEDIRRLYQFENKEISVTVFELKNTFFSELSYKLIGKDIFKLIFMAFNKITKDNVCIDNETDFDLGVFTLLTSYMHIVTDKFDISNKDELILFSKKETIFVYNNGKNGIVISNIIYFQKNEDGS